MLGGYYLGQAYLGISGLPSTGSLTVQDSSHSLSSDNITLIQQHVIALADAVHSLTSDNLDLIEHKTLVIDSTIHSLTSPEIVILQSHILVVDESLLELMDNSRRIINLADYQYFAGTYIKEFSSSGDLQDNGELEAGTLILKHKNLGSFEPTEIVSGVLIKTIGKQGQLN